MGVEKFDLQVFRFRLRGCILRLDIAVNNLHAWNMSEFFVSYKVMITVLTEIIEMIANHKEIFEDKGLKIEITDFFGVISGLMNSQEDKDYILLADLMELQVRPFLIGIMEQILCVTDEKKSSEFFQLNSKALGEKNPVLKKEINSLVEKKELPKLENEYVIEDTSSGYVTLKVKRDGKEFYYYSNNNPHIPIIKWLERQIKEVDRYHILGIGLGYELYHLYVLSGKSVPIDVYESDLNLIAISMHYLRFDAALEDKVTIHYDPDLKKIKKAFGKENEKVLLYPPAIRNISNLELRRSFEKFKIMEDSAENGRIILNGNFTQNQLYFEEHKSEVYLADELRDEFSGKTVYIVAAGPSLDQNIELLKKRTENSIVLATGTVFKKLMGLSIKPDYVIITDPNERVLVQIRGYEQSDIPLLLLATANEKFMKRYKGKKYLIYQKDYPKSEMAAERQDSKVYGTGGSVSTTALDIAISLEAKKIIFLGLDLAYTNQLAHASDTSNQIATDESDLIPVKAWNGDLVFSNEKFISYREWIENRIQEKDCVGIAFINATEGGSYIAGMKHEKLQNIL